MTQNTSTLKIYFSSNNTFLTLVNSTLETNAIHLTHKVCTESKKNWLTVGQTTSASNSNAQNESSTRVRKSRFIRPNLTNVLGNTFVRRIPHSKVILQLSAGLCGARNAQKTKLVDPMIEKLLEQTSIRSFEVEIKGFSPIREKFLESLFSYS